MGRARVDGIVLAAGAGTRFGGPKALARDAGGVPWVARVSAALRAGGCRDVIAVLGARAEEARALVPEGVRIVVAPDWAEGLSRSLAAGLAAANDRAEAVVVATVDIPELPAAAVARVIAAAPEPRDALVRATYGGRPGHPALLGAAHWASLASEMGGDTGAGPYLARHDAERVDCLDLWDGHDRDHLR